jgi:Lon protease-like protein
VATPSDQPPPPLPTVLSIFPLTGVLLLPRGRLPLNIFEPRYLAMIEDALGTADRLIGMVQPAPGHVEDLQGGPPPEVYPIGCAGRITSFSETDDGRYLITLTGVSRFSIAKELPLGRGYRRVLPDWNRFKSDREPDRGTVDRTRLIEALKRYFLMNGIKADWDAINQTPDERLITTLAMICPFQSSEKQALLETEDLATRASTMLTLIEMALLSRGGSDPERPRH